MSVRGLAKKMKGDLLEEMIITVCLDRVRLAHMVVKLPELLHLLIRFTVRDNISCKCQSKRSREIRLYS